MYSSATASYSPSSVSAAKPRKRQSTERKTTNAKALTLKTIFIGAQVKTTVRVGCCQKFPVGEGEPVFQAGAKYEALHHFAVVGLSLARCFFCLRTGGTAGKE